MPRGTFAATDAVIANPGSGGDAFPSNPYTRRLSESHPWRRIVNYLWTAPPQQVVAKGKALLRGKTKP